MDVEGEEMVVVDDFLRPRRDDLPGSAAESSEEHLGG